MKCTIRDLKVGQEYVFIRAIVKQKEDIPVYHGTLKEIDESGILSAIFEMHEFGNREAFIYKTIDNPYCGDHSNDLLTKPEGLNANFIAGEEDDIMEEMKKAFHMCVFIVSDSIENGINEYNEFLEWSLKKYQERIDKADEYDKPMMITDLESKKFLYKEQIDWLKTNYL